MAGEWINRDTGLRSHPAILHLWLHFEKKHHKGLLADCVCEMWAYADQFGHVDGDDILCDLTPELLDAHVDLPGFTAALVRFRENRADKKPWVLVEGDRIRFPGLYAVMDSSSKRRAEKREKKKRERAARRQRGDGGQSVAPLSHDKVATVAPLSHDTWRTGGPQQNTEHRTQITEHGEPSPLPPPPAKQAAGSGFRLIDQSLCRMFPSTVGTPANRSGRVTADISEFLVNWEGKVPAFDDWLPKALSHIETARPTKWGGAMGLLKALAGQKVDQGLDPGEDRPLNNVPLRVTNAKCDDAAVDAAVAKVFEEKPRRAAY